MSELLERKRPRDGTRTLPKRQPTPPPDEPRPTRMIRRIEWTALIVAVAAAGILAVWLAGSGRDDAEVVPEYGELTQAVAEPDGLDRWIANHSRAVAEPDGLDRWIANHSRAVAEPDGLDRWIANHSGAVAEPDGLDRWIANHSRAVAEPDGLDRWIANHS